MKDILSANKFCDVKVPELADYVTLKFNLPRTQVEEATEHLSNAVEKPIRDALTEAGLSVDDID